MTVVTVLYSNCTNMKAKAEWSRVWVNPGLEEERSVHLFLKTRQRH